MTATRFLVTDLARELRWQYRRQSVKAFTDIIAELEKREGTRRRILDRISVRTPRREGTPGRSPRTRTSPGPLLCTLRRNQTMEVRQ